MVRQFMKYTFGAVALYLMVSGVGGKNLISEGSRGASGFVKTLQGR